MNVCLIETGLANMASVAAAFRRLGASVTVTREPAAVEAAARVVLPGVGAFGPAMETLHAAGLVDVLRARITALRPTLAICLGMQLLAKGSDESPGVEGLGALATHVSAFPDTVSTPQFGWNRVDFEGPDRIDESAYVYFANSFRITHPPPGWRASWSVYGGRFCAALQRGDVLACQFHPELSGAYGERLLAQWLFGETTPC